MLLRLTILNYALIDELQVTFQEGLNIVTGETGAGKSIILGALSLILGARADATVMRDPAKKCVVEGSFRIDGYQLEPFFADNDLDYDSPALLRREILPSGKSRAFINDTPVNLVQLRELTLRLIDIHSQHQNLELGKQLFQLQIVDCVADTGEMRKEYESCFEMYNNLLSKLKVLKDEAEKSKSDLDYYTFQLEQLEQARLHNRLEQEELEEERERLTHALEIKSALTDVAQLLDGEQPAAVQNLKEAANRLSKIKTFLKPASSFLERLGPVTIELQDIAREAAYLADITEHNPDQLQRVSDRLDLIYSLQQKHRVDSLSELINLQEELATKVANIGRFDDELALLQTELEMVKTKLTLKAEELSDRRKIAFPVIEGQVVDLLRQLGIPNATFRVTSTTVNDFRETGIDRVSFLFSANKDALPDEISRIASGGELSRVMLAIKTLVSGTKMLPAIVFDEIDAGISGEIALKMGNILKKLSSGMQVINITHLPQIAAKGQHHYMVYKFEQDHRTFTSIRKLSHEERINELAKMVGGNNPSDAARRAAIELMG